MTQVVSDENIVISPESITAKENIIARKTIVYETLVDPTVTRVASEKLKTQLFTRLGILTPKPEDIQFVSIDKYYEPYIVVSGTYSIDYYRKCSYTVKIDEQVLEVILLDHKFMPEHDTTTNSKNPNIISLEGEERLVCSAKGSFILDRYGRNATLEKLPSAPSEKNPKRVIAKFDIEEVAQNKDVEFVREKIFLRPNDIKRVVNEVFEVGERVVIYTPRFRILYRNAKNGAERALEFDGVTSERIEKSNSAFSQSMRIIKSRFK